MGRRVVALHDPVPVARQDLTGRRNQHRANGHLAALSRRFRFQERECYGFLVSHTFPENIILAEDSTGAGERIAKVIARAGICSRRDAEKLIEEGRVELNGEKVTSQGVKAGDHDVIAIDGKPLGEPEPARLWRYHKPSGLVTTHKDPQGRPTVFANLPASLPRVVSVGRLDFNSEGLLLLTNDGDASDLARLAAQLFAGAPHPLLYLAGEDRSSDLTVPGIDVRIVVVYRAVKSQALPGAEREALARGEIDAVLHFSERSAEAFVDSIREMLQVALAPVHFCLSDRVAVPLQRAGAQRVEIAARPDEASLLALVTPKS